MFSELTIPDDCSYADNDCPCSVSVAVMTYPNKQQLRGENDYLPSISRFQSIIEGKSRQELPAASNVTPHTRAKSMHASAQLAFLHSSGPDARSHFQTSVKAIKTVPTGMPTETLPQVTVGCVRLTDELAITVTRKVICKCLHIGFWDATE